jgi:hypothetical protein
MSQYKIENKLLRNDQINLAEPPSSAFMHRERVERQRLNSNITFVTEKRNGRHMRFDVFMTMNIWTVVFWVMMAS